VSLTILNTRGDRPLPHIPDTGPAPTHDASHRRWAACPELVTWRNIMRDARLNRWLVTALGLVTGLGLLYGCSNSPSGGKYTEYKLGATNPRSGDQASVGDQQVFAMEVAVEEINAKGGVDGVPLKLVVEDNQAKPTTAVTALQKLITVDKVPLAFTSYSTAQLAQVPIADQNEVVMVNVGASSTELVNAGNYIVHVQPNAASYLRVSTNYMVKDLKQTGRWAILYVNEAMGRSFDLYVKTLLPKYEVKDVFEDNWESSTVTDFRSIIAKALAFKPDTVFIGGFGNDLGLCLKQLREAGFKGQVMSAWGGGTVSEPAGLAAVDAVYAEQVIPDNDRIKTLTDKLMNGKKLPFVSTQAINSYDSVYMVAEAIKYAKDHYGATYFTGPNLKKALVEKKEYTTLSTPGVMDPATQYLSRQLAVKTWEAEGGKLKPPKTIKVYTSAEVDAMPAGDLKKKS
jgi:branched-chain amino acid transport system substrate-binding protein